MIASTFEVGRGFAARDAHRLWPAGSFPAR
jgi:hypothetical protein